MRIDKDIKRALKRQMLVDDKYWDGGFTLPTIRVEWDMRFWRMWK